MLRQQGIRLGKLREMLMIKRQLQQLRPDGLSSLLRKDFELLKEGLMLIEDGLVVRYG